MLTAIAAIAWILPIFAGPAENRTSPRQSKGGAKTTKTAPKTQTASLSGCIDEQNGNWVLVHEQTRAIIANLVAEGFPAEGFAKHLGEKVTVRGTASPDVSSSVFKVRTVETISETCSAR